MVVTYIRNKIFNLRVRTKVRKVYYLYVFYNHTREDEDLNSSLFRRSHLRSP